MVNSRVTRALVLASALGVAMAATGCVAKTASPTTSSTSSTPPTSAGGTTTVPKNVPGVTATTINIGAISTKSGTLAGLFDGLAPGMIAYFKMVDADGGVDGRQIVLSYDLDDGGLPAQFNQDASTIIDQDHAFAVGAASPWFGPNAFSAAGIPTYGYNVTGNWQGPANLFAAGGSVQSYSAGVPTMAYFIKKENATKVGFISYGPGLAQSSYDACQAYVKDLRAAGYDVTFDDVSALINGSYTSDVQRLKSSGAQIIASCMQASDNVTLARDIQQYGVHVTQVWFNGYDQTLLNQYSSLLQGVYVNNAGSVPFEASDTALFGSTYAGMQQYITEMNKYEPTFTYNEVAFQGWQSAVLLVDGIKAVGKDLSQANVIAATNKITDFNAGGLSTPVNWETAHTEVTGPNCSSWIKVEGKKFVAVFGTGQQVFVCVGNNPKDPAEVTPPPGTPGA